MKQVMPNAERLFADLPSALVSEVLERTKELGLNLLETFTILKKERSTRREQLSVAGLLGRESDYEYVSAPTTCGVDGSFALERLLAIDLIATAAVAMEGLTPPSESRYWPEPRHQVWIETDAHDPDTGTIARSIMMGMELELASSAPHDVVFLDGSLTTPLIFFNQALSKIAADGKQQRSKSAEKFLACAEGYFVAYNTVLGANRSDKYWIAVPKYTTRREIGKMMGWSDAQDDRSMLTGLLEPGEITKPVQLERPIRPWHVNTEPFDNPQTAVLIQSFINRISEVFVVYYRPFSWLPTLRLEMGRSVANTPARLATVLQAIKHQCGAPAMIEPYPLYMADRMVKSLAMSIPTIRQVTSQHLAEAYEGDVSDVFLGLHGYRTESGS